MKLFWRPSRVQCQALGVLLAGLILSGCSSPSDNILFSDNPQPPSALTGSGSSTGETPGDLTAARFHVGDNVTVDYSGTAAKIPENVETITEDGNITLPYIGTVHAAGLTAGELQKEIRDRYVPQYYVHLTVTVAAPQRVYYVGGEVKLPNRYVYAGQTTVTKAIQAAGDFTDFANRTKVKLIRNNGQVIIVNCVKALKNPALDPPVYPGDQIQVPRRIW